MAPQAGQLQQHFFGSYHIYLKEVEKIIMLRPANDPRYKAPQKTADFLQLEKESKTPEPVTPTISRGIQTNYKNIIYSFTIHNCTINKYIKLVSRF